MHINSASTSPTSSSPFIFVFHSPRIIIMHNIPPKTIRHITQNIHFEICSFQPNICIKCLANVLRAPYSSNTILFFVFFFFFLPFVRVCEYIPFILFLSLSLPLGTDSSSVRWNAVHNMPKGNDTRSIQATLPRFARTIFTIGIRLGHWGNDLQLNWNVNYILCGWRVFTVNI